MNRTRSESFSEGGDEIPVNEELPPISEQLLHSCSFESVAQLGRKRAASAYASQRATCDDPAWVDLSRVGTRMGSSRHVARRNHTIGFQKDR